MSDISQINKIGGFYLLALIDDGGLTKWRFKNRYIVDLFQISKTVNTMAHLLCLLFGGQPIDISDRLNLDFKDPLLLYNYYVKNLQKLIKCSLIRNSEGVLQIFFIGYIAAVMPQLNSALVTKSTVRLSATSILTHMLTNPVIDYSYFPYKYAVNPQAATEVDATGKTILQLAAGGNWEVAGNVPSCASVISQAKLSTKGLDLATICDRMFLNIKLRANKFFTQSNPENQVQLLRLRLNNYLRSKYYINPQMLISGADDTGDTILNDICGKFILGLTQSSIWLSTVTALSSEGKFIQTRPASIELINHGLYRSLILPMYPVSKLLKYGLSALNLISVIFNTNIGDRLKAPDITYIDFSAGELWGSPGRTHKGLVLHSLASGTPDYGRYTPYSGRKLAMKIKVMQAPDWLLNGIGLTSANTTYDTTNRVQLIKNGFARLYHFLSYCSSNTATLTLLPNLLNIKADYFVGRPLKLNLKDVQSNSNITDIWQQLGVFYGMVKGVRYVYACSSVGTRPSTFSIEMSMDCITNSKSIYSELFTKSRNFLLYKRN